LPDFVSEKQSVWNYLKTARKPIMLYGMGDGALKIMSVFREYNIEIKEIFASDEFVRGHSFEGYKVKRYSEICGSYDDFIIVLAFAVFRDDLTAKIYDMAQRHEVLAPDVPVAGGGLFTPEYLQEHEKQFERVYNLLADDMSRQVLADILNFKISGKIEYLRRAATPKAEAYSLLRLSRGEDYIDLGAYNGDTVTEVVDLTGGCRSIVAVEPDAKNYKKLLKQAELLRLDNFYPYNIGIHSAKGEMAFAGKAGRQSALAENGINKIQVDCIDNIALPQGASLIKLDVEGAELAALRGGVRTIKKHMPKLIVSAYHRNSDLFELPLFIDDNFKGYSIYLRHQQYIPAWETNLYCIKE